MENFNLDLKTLQMQHNRLDNAIRNEECNIWKDLMKLEALKKAKLKKKDELLRMRLHSMNNN